MINIHSLKAQYEVEDESGLKTADHVEMRSCTPMGARVTAKEEEELYPWGKERPVLCFGHDRWLQRHS